ncbi:MAG: ABC transporter permease [Bacteroidales bacterium]|nr:ABC transporter permease [Bacteroidales bacterium]
MILLLLVPLLSGIVFSILLRYSPTQSYIYFYNPNIPVWILIILTTAIFTGLVNSGHEFIYLRHFHQHENRIIDKTYSYLSSTVFKYLILAIVQAVFLILPSVLIIENGFHFFTLFIVSFLLICWGSLISLIISSLCKQISTVYLVIPLVIIPQMIFSGAMINFGDFNKIINDKGKIPFIADFVPMRWATEAVITDFYTSNPYYRDIYPVRQYINNAVYYLDYFIPQVEEIAKKDKIRAEKILKNETENPGFVDFFNGSQLEFRPIEDFYSAQIQKYLFFEDSILTMKSEINMQKYKYSNEAVNKVINNPYSTPLVIWEKSILRNFKSVYSFPCTKDLNRSYFKSYGKFGNIELVCFTYNSVILSIYIILLIILLFIFKKSKKRIGFVH